MNQEPDRNADRDDIDTEDLRDHVFDGIREYDKKLPNWWLMTFYGSIVFAILYWFLYHITGIAPTPEKRFEQRRAEIAAEARASGGEEVTDASLFELSRDEMAVEAGEAAYSSNCAACHGTGLDGGIGPALTDDEWVHGGEPTDIRATIRDGVAAAGMPAWRASLGDGSINEIVAFIVSVNPNLEPPGEGEE